MSTPVVLEDDDIDAAIKIAGIWEHITVVHTNSVIWGNQMIRFWVLGDCDIKPGNDGQLTEIAGARAVLVLKEKGQHAQEFFLYLRPYIDRMDVALWLLRTFKVSEDKEKMRFAGELYRALKGPPNYFWRQVRRMIERSQKRH